MPNIFPLHSSASLQTSSPAGRLFLIAAHISFLPRSYLFMEYRDTSTCVFEQAANQMLQSIMCWYASAD